MENLHLYPPLKGGLQEESQNLKIMSKLDELVLFNKLNSLNKHTDKMIVNNYKANKESKIHQKTK